MIISDALQLGVISLFFFAVDTSLSAMHDGSGEYELVGFVSHMGSNTACGHYVCHVKEVSELSEFCTALLTCILCLSNNNHTCVQKDRWVIFNDEKVAVSERPPIDLGYMYLFRRIGQ
jgi:ubiquitin carboxyl-terminal hydrolase 5/13